MIIPTVDIAKIRATCKCLDVTLTDAEIEALFLPALYAISSITGWSKGTPTGMNCNTMYKGLRVQRFEYSNISRINQNYSQYYNPYGNPYMYGYIPFGYGFGNNWGFNSGSCCRLRDWYKLCSHLIDTTTITGIIYTIDNSGETQIIVPNSAIHFSVAENSILIDSQWLIDNNIEKCLCTCQRYWLDISYMAGYDTLPDCVFNAICFVYNYLNLLTIGGDCSTGACQKLDRMAWNSIISSVSVGDISYSYKFPTNQLSIGFSKLDDIQLNQIHRLDNMICIDYNGIL